MIQGVALATGTDISLDYNRYYPATINHESAALRALDVAASVGNAQLAPEPAFTSEDFAFMLQACEGAYIWLGQGTEQPTIPLHHPHYDFNDDVLPTGAGYWVTLVENELPS